MLPGPVLKLHPRLPQTRLEAQGCTRSRSPQDLPAQGVIYNGSPTGQSPGATLRSSCEELACPLSRQAYVDMRKVGSSRGMVSAYPRQLESLTRLAEAHAKVRFSSKVEAIDVEEAKRLHREALKQSATDPRTGIVDISILTTGGAARAF